MTKSSSGRLFAVIPGAGVSRRMGKPKLLLPLGEQTVMARLLEILDDPAVSARVVVVRSDDAPLREEATAAGGTVVSPPVDPPDMRASVSFALDEITRRFQPTDRDGWLLIPADHPVLDRQLVARLIRQWKESQAGILVPTFGGRRGHPTFFRWELAHEVARIPADRGLDWVLKQQESRLEEFPVDDDSILFDLDTPEDYERIRRRYNPPTSTE